MNRIRRWLGWTVAMGVGVALAAALAVAWQYRAVSRQPFLPPTPTLALDPATGVRLGDPVTATVSLSLPWHQRPGLATVTAGEGAQVVGAVRIRRGRCHWGRWDWQLVTILQPYRDGETGTGRIEFRIEPSAQGQAAMAVEIPGFAVAAADVPPAGEPELAGRLAPTWRDHWDALRRQPWQMLALVGAAMLLLVAGLVLLACRLMRRKLASPPPPPPWEVALSRLRELRTDLVAGAMAAETALQRLSDVVRAYLEARFSLHAPCQTTVEFLRDLERPGSPLGDGDRAFLKDFLTAADLVKFARQPADHQAITDALGHAETLVRGTVPAADAVSIPGTGR